MVWPFSSTSTDTKSEPQQPTPTSIPIRTTPTTTPTLQTSDSDFHTAFPHLAPASRKPTTTASDEDYDDPSIPSTMSCRAAFDSAFYCSSFGGHFNDIYRWGQLRTCSEHWADWRFCMSIKGRSAEARAELIRARYKEKEVEMMKKPNSEDVWQRRRKDEMIERPFSLAEDEGKGA
jgi:hypothetical protein